ncbi:P-loop containing nucleoside triphosphate hydrolase protein [Suillus lakei]|nr:P-loop containing nucleoside triphosphate hydrolase protein [Suillus lakei]
MSHMRIYFFVHVGFLISTKCATAPSHTSPTPFQPPPSINSVQSQASSINHSPLPCTAPSFVHPSYPTSAVHVTRPSVSDRTTSARHVTCVFTHSQPPPFTASTTHPVSITPTPPALHPHEILQVLHWLTAVAGRSYRTWFMLGILIARSQSLGVIEKLGVRDIETIDSNLASSLLAVNSSLATFAAAIITVVVFLPIFLIPAVVIGFLYRMPALGYLKTGRVLRRMELNSQSLLFSGFDELLLGIVTVQAFSAEQRSLDEINVTTKMWYNFWMTNRWLLLNFDALDGLAVLATTLFALSGYVSAALSSMLYLDLPQEPSAIIDSSRPPAYWPSGSTKEGLLTVKDLVTECAPGLPPVLHNVSFTLNAKEKIVLLGRTGNGKSILAMSILRFVDPVSGRILIDGIDISTIGVHDLRSRLTFIPQRRDATLFSGTLRDILHPFNEHEDSEYLDVLYCVQMLGQSAHQSQHTSRAPSRASTPDDVASSAASTAVNDVDSKTTITLDTQVPAGGANFSQGQRQLIAMARALLKRSSLIATIREEFTDSSYCLQSRTDYED